MKVGVSVVVALMVSLPAAAQDRSSAFVGGSVSAANTESRTEIALTGSFGFRFSRVVSFVIEATAVPSAEPVFATNPVILSAGAPPPSTSIAIFPGPTYSNLGGRIVLLTNTARIDIPTTSTRVTPFFSAGGGVANVRSTADFSYELPLPLFPPGTPTIPVRPFFQHITSSSTDMALTLGGGAGVRVAKSLWLDVDLRLFRLLGDDDRNLGRFGVGVRYAF